MAWLTTEDGKYTIESITAATFPGALEVIHKDFFLDETVCIGSEVNKNPLAIEELLELCADAALDGVSLVAVTTDTRKVVAVVFNKIQVVPNKTEKSFFEIFSTQRCKHESSRALVDFMVDLNAKCHFFERCGVDCSLEIMFLGTLREHRQRKLGKLLCQTSVELARKLKDGPVSTLTVKDLGPKYAFMTPRKPINKVPKICTGLWSAIGSQKIGQSLGFSVVVRVSLKDYIYKGKPFSDRVGVETFVDGTVKRIDEEN